MTEDSYQYYSFSLNRDATVELETVVRSGPAVDIVLTDSDEFEEFKRGNRFKTYNDFDQTDTPGETSEGGLREGDYVVIVDNTNAIDARPPANMQDDAARVEVSLTAE